MSVEEEAGVSIEENEAVSSGSSEPTGPSGTADPVEPAEKGKKKKKLLIPLIAAGAVVVLVLALVLALPAIRYSSGVKSMEAEDYAAAARSFEAAGEYKDADRQAGIARRANAFALGNAAFDAGDYAAAVEYFEQAEDHDGAAQMLKKAQRGVLYSEGVALMQEGKYREAIKKLTDSRNFSDAKQQIENSYRALGEQEFSAGDYAKAAADFVSGGAPDRAADCAEALIDKEEYTAAAEILAGQEGPALSYALAKAALSEADYQTAITNLENAGDYRDAKTIIPQTWYEYGKSEIEKNEPASAEKCFVQAGSYSDSESMITVCKFLQAEKYFKTGYLNSAKTAYQTLPSDYTYNGISVADRLAVLEKNKTFVAMCGKWRASGENRIETRETYNSGYYYYWYTTYTAPYQYVEITCTISDSGTVTMSGSAQFYRYTNYSSNSYNLNRDTKTVTFSKVIKSRPSYLDIGSSTHLTFSGRAYTLVYKYVDQSKTYADYTYTSNYTYGTLVEAY